ncbi:MAG TPA: SCP-2 sterol transfer family protein [Thioploca sp.]|nr:SCP-2 sterol transfer family protein [Thioploca sp.]
MSNLFCETWMQEFATLWNTDQEIAYALYEQSFNANIGYGFTDVRHPTGILIIVHGKIESAGLYKGQPLDWDLRADIEDWKSWLKEGLSLARLGFVVAHQKRQFKTGDDRKILRTPRLATAFLRRFGLMSQVTTQFPAYEHHAAIAKMEKGKAKLLAPFPAH